MAFQELSERLHPANLAALPTPSISISFLSAALILLLISTKFEPVAQFGQRLFWQSSFGQSLSKAAWLSSKPSRSALKSKPKPKQKQTPKSKPSSPLPSPDSILNSENTPIKPTKSLFPSISTPTKSLNPDSKTMVSCSTGNNFNIFQFHNGLEGSAGNADPSWDMSFQMSPAPPVPSSSSSTVERSFASFHPSQHPFPSNMAIGGQSAYHNNHQNLSQMAIPVPKEMPLINHQLHPSSMDASPYSIYSSSSSLESEKTLSPQHQSSYSSSDASFMPDLPGPNANPSSNTTTSANNSSNSIPTLSQASSSTSSSSYSPPTTDSFTANSLDPFDYDSLFRLGDGVITEMDKININNNMSNMSNLNNKTNASTASTDFTSSLATFLSSSPFSSLGDVAAFTNTQRKLSADEVLASDALYTKDDFGVAGGGGGLAGLPTDFSADFASSLLDFGLNGFDVDSLGAADSLSTGIVGETVDISVPQLQSQSVVPQGSGPAPLVFSESQPSQVRAARMVPTQQRLPQPRYSTSPVQMLPSSTSVYSIPALNQYTLQNAPKNMVPMDLKVMDAQLGQFGVTSGAANDTNGNGVNGINMGSINGVNNYNMSMGMNMGMDMGMNGINNNNNNMNPLNTMNMVDLNMGMSMVDANIVNMNMTMNTNTNMNGVLHDPLSSPEQESSSSEGSNSPTFVELNTLQRQNQQHQPTLQSSKHVSSSTSRHSTPSTSTTNSSTSSTPNRSNAVPSAHHHHRPIHPQVVIKHGRPVAHHQPPVANGAAGTTAPVSTGRTHGRPVLARGLPFVCPHCSTSFRIRGYLTRHIKKHAIQKAYTCPFYALSSSGTHGGPGNDNACRHTGGFSRRDTYKTHLKARHFEYPSGTRSENRSKVGGNCRGCGMAFESNEEWVEEHIHNRQCAGLAGLYSP